MHRVSATRPIGHESFFQASIGDGLADGATLGEATQPSGAVTVSGELGATIYVSFVRATAGAADAKTAVTKSVLGKGGGTLIAVTLTAGEVRKLGDGIVNVIATQAVGPGNQSQAIAKSFMLDTSAPRIVGVIPPASRIYRQGNVLRFVVTYSESVLVSGAPSLSLTMEGNIVRKADYVSGAGTNSLVFEYRVGVGDSARRGPTLATVIALNGGRIRDFTGNEASLLFRAPVLTRVAIL